MVAQTRGRRDGGGFGAVAETTNPSLVVLSDVNLIVNSTAAADGAAGGGRIWFSVSGGGPEAAAVGTVNGVKSAVIGPQRNGAAMQICEEWLRASGITPFVAERWGPEVAAEVLVVGIDGDRVRNGQSVEPLGLDDLDARARDALEGAQIVVAGCQQGGDRWTDLLEQLRVISPGAVVGVVADENTITSAGWDKLARRFDYVQIPSQLGSCMPGGTSDQAKNALRLRHVAGDGARVAVVGVDGGLCWDTENWARVGGLPGMGGCPWAGLVYATAYLVGSEIFGLTIERATRYGVSAANLAVQGDRTVIAMPVSASV